MESGDAHPRKKRATERKERHLFFAYRGSDIDTSKLEALHICQASGATAANGLRYVQMTLLRNHARRAANLKNVVTEYNKAVGAQFRVVVEPHKDAVFPPTDEWTAKIQAGSGGWQWPAVTAVQSEVKPKSRKVVALSALVESLGLDPRSLNMRGAEDEVMSRYRGELGKEPDFNGMYDEADANFILSVLRRCFAVELSFSIEPPKALPGHVRASLDGWMGDCLPDVMEREAEPLEPATIVEFGAKNRRKIEFRSSKPPQAIIVEYLRKMVREWSELGEYVLCAGDLKFALNKNHASGVYKTTDACGFMRPFVHDGCVEMYCVMSKDARPAYEFRVHVERLCAYLQSCA
jgi:hypothetical protein